MSSPLRLNAHERFKIISGIFIGFSFSCQVNQSSG
jgi:hypothetical protein